MADESFQNNGRNRLVVSVLVIVWMLLAGRLIFLQGINRRSLADRADRQRTFVEIIPARPGDILDRQGRLLATTVTTRSLYAVPSRIEDPSAVVGKLAGVLNLDPQEMFQRLSSHRTKHFLWIKRRLSEEEAEKVRKLKLPEAIWGFRQEYLRRYPQGELAAHLLGLRDLDGNGQGGLEQSFDSVLRGRDGQRALLRDARGHVIHIQDAESELPEHGRSIVLALDTVIQLYAEQELDSVMHQWRPKHAGVCVLDPQTGDVLAMASRPTFDPNRPANVPDAAWKNTNIASVYEPGSTFKPFVTAWAIETGAVEPDEIFHCEHGEYRMGRRILHDHHSYGELNVIDILVKSSNVGMAKIGERLTNTGLHKATRVFGFGSRTGSGLPGELEGVVRPLRKWNFYSTGSVPMGQEISVTPLQMIVAHAALANGGMLKSPRLVLKYGDALSSGYERQDNLIPLGQVVSQVVSPKTANWIVQGPMTGVVNRGTGKKAQLDGYSVFGKTGTAQKFDPATGKYSSRLHVSSFLCGAPSDHPRALVLVVVDEPSVSGTHYGGTIAAPPAAHILKKTLIHLGVPANGDLLRSAGR
jgi:cell division protein FtsI (penicillin-binding protein 3)